jgi:pimeloyl-ACP methyl ester carboxylesterase
VTTVNANGLVAEVEGDGVPVVMIHGLGGTSNLFQPQMDVLRGNRVIRIDLPGSGRSPLPAREAGFDDFCAAILGLLQVLGVAEAHFVGHSLGTIICQKIAVERPATTRSLVLFGALAEPGEATRTALNGRAAEARRQGMDAIADQIVANALSASTRASQPAAVAFVRESLMRQDPEGYARTCEALAKAKAVDPSRIGAPALLITGDADTVNPPSVARELADRIRGGRLATVDRGGHWLPIEKPVESNRWIAEFLKQVEH